MSCSQCQHENRPDASFCGGCGYPLLRPDPPRVRDRPPPRLIEIVAAIGIVITGLSVISGIVVASPRWQRIIASWRESFAARSASMRPVIGTATDTSSPAVNKAAVRNAEVRGESPAYPPGGATEAIATQPQAILPNDPVPPRPARSQEARRPVDRAPIRAQSDSTHVMASLLVAQLGQDPAWRTALANADAHSSDSPEHAYWRAVATAIRDGGGQRSRP
jgi:hypothetical protein